MGHRASYVVVENRSPAFGYSHWGAVSIPETVLSGPEETVSYIRALESDDHLLDTTWAEGGILVDMDTRTLIFHGGGDITIFPYLRRMLLLALRRLWPGWTVDYARFGMADFARHLGLDIATVLTDDPQGDTRAITLAELSDPHPEFETCVLTVTWPDGTISDYRLAFYAHMIAALGPDLLSVLQQREPVALPHEREKTLYKACLDDGLYIDVPNKAIWLWDASQLDPRWLEEIGHAWPTWRVDGHIEGVVRQAVLSGRDPTPFMVPDAEAARELVAILSSGWSIDPGALFKLAISNPPPGTQHIEVASGFLRADPPTLTADERRKLLEHVLWDILG